MLRVVLPGCASLLNVFFKTCIFSFISCLLPQMFLVRCAHSPHPTPQAHWNPTTASSCLSSDNDLQRRTASRSFLSQKALRSVAEGSTADTVQKKKRKEKKTNSVICRCKNESHHLAFQNNCGSLSSSIIMGKNSVQVQMPSGVTW